MDTRQLTLTVTGSYTITASRRLGEVGVPFRATLAASGGAAPLTWSSAGGLPQGLTLDSHGAISGEPKHAGTYTVGVHFVDANGSAADAQVSLVVRPRLAVATRSLRPAHAGHVYKATLAARGGVAAFRWSLAGGSLPRGLRLAGGTGTISGSPSHGGTFRFTLRVRDALGAVSTKRVTLRVR